MHTTRKAAPRRLGIALGAASALTLGVLAMAGPAGPAGATARNSASVSNGALSMTASSASDRLALRLKAGDPNTLEVDFGDDGTADASFDRSTFTAIDVSLRSGNDQFRVDQAAGTFADEALTVHGNSGSDTFAGGDGAEVFDGGSGSDSADPNRGDDTGLMGSGTDTFRWDPGDGSDTVEGDSGTDTLDFNGANVAEKMSLEPNGGRALFLRDVATIRMDMDNVERLDLTALGGIDTMTVKDMSGTDFKQADIDLQGAAGGGDGADDVVTVEGTNRGDNVRVRGVGGVVRVRGLKVTDNIIGAEPSDQLNVNTLGGNDDVDVADSATAIMAVAVDLGTGQH
jgi:hypothetical protein